MLPYVALNSLRRKATSTARRIFLRRVQRGGFGLVRIEFGQSIRRVLLLVRAAGRGLLISLPDEMTVQEEQ
jgi:hypothetical protein